MALHVYKAIDPDGRIVQGRIDALNLDDLELRLKRMALDLVDGQPANLPRRYRISPIPRREIIHFCFHLEMLERAGVPLLAGLADLRDSLENPRFREVIASLIEAIEGGQTLSQSMEEHPNVFDKVFVRLIEAGESTGRIDEVLKRLGESLKWEDELVSQSKKILIYPAFVAMIVFAATFFLMIYTVPQLKQFIRNMGETLPLQTRILFYISDTLMAWWYLALPIPVLTVAGIYFLLHINPAMKAWFDGFKLRLPLIGPILRKIILSRFSNTFALLYSSGIPILDAIRTTQGIVGNAVVQQGLEHVERLVVEGQNLTTAFQQISFFPPLVLRMLRIGESTGSLDVALMNVNYFYTRDIRESVEKVQQFIEPTLTVLLGCLLGWIMLSILGPIYDVISRIKT